RRRADADDAGRPPHRRGHARRAGAHAPDARALRQPADRAGAARRLLGRKAVRPMVSEAPPFWWGDADWRAWALWPFSAAYGAVAARRLRNAPREKVPAPVLCVGNLTVGGSGKTPVAIALAGQAAAMGLKP